MARIGMRELAGLCRRLGTSLAAGVDVRTVWQRETERQAGWQAGHHYRQIAEDVARGQSVRDAIEASGSFFPALFREMVAVGEETGHQAEVFLQLAHHYDGLLRLRRLFLAGITWPMIELGLAIGIIGFLIWILGVIGNATGTPVDVLGLGLIGNRGLAIYALFLLGVAAGLFILWRAVRSGVVWVRPVQYFVMRLPALGGALRTMALARLTWALHLTLKTGMDLRRALPLSVQSSQNVEFIEGIARLNGVVNAGGTLTEAFEAAGRYPVDFLDAVRVGEDSGNLDESMAHLSRQYEDRARLALNTLTVLAGVAVFALVAAIIILAIFRIAFFYINTLNDALQGV